jgi:hypothetical protein
MFNSRRAKSEQLYFEELQFGVITSLRIGARGQEAQAQQIDLAMTKP